MRTALILLALSSLAYADNGTPIFRLFLAKEAALALIPAAPSVRRTKIAEQIGARLMEGMAYTNGKVAVELIPSEDDARVRLVLDFETSARTTSTTHPRPDIQVNIYTTAITQTHVTKVIVFKPDHLETTPAEATSRTAITLHGASAITKGGFAGEKKRQAEQQAMQAARESIPNKETDTAARVNQQILDQVESKAEPTLKDLNRDYRTIFFDPLFTDNRIPGRPHYYTAEDGFRVVVEPPAGAWETLEPLPVLSPKTILAMNLHQSLLDAKLGNLAGKVYDELEYEAFLLRSGMDGDAHAWGGVADRTYIRFCDKKPMHFVFDHDEADITVCVKGVKIADGAWEGGATLHLKYSLAINGPQSVRMVRSPIEVARQGDVAISDTALRRFEERYSLIFPPTQEVGALPIPTSSAILQDMEIESAHMDKGWFTVEWKEGATSAAAK